MSHRRLSRASRRASAQEDRALARPRCLSLVYGKSEDLLPNGPYPLPAHLLDAAAVILALDALGSPLLPKRALRGLGPDGVLCLALLAALHDVGKATTGFASRAAASWSRMWAGTPPSAIGATRGHTGPGQASALLEEWPLRMAASDQPLTGTEVEELRQFIGLVISAHHGRITSAMSQAAAHDELARSFDHTADWVSVRSDLAELVWQALGRPRLAPDGEDNVLSAVAACGIVPFADWVVSQTHFIEGHRRCHLPEAWDAPSAARFLASGVQAAQAELRRMGLAPLTLADLPFAQRYLFAPRGLQRSVCEQLESHVHGPGLLVVTDRTGGGKTELAQEAVQIFRRLLGQHLGVGVFLPTMATTNAQFARWVKDLMPLLGQDATVERLHSMAAFSEDADRILRDLKAADDARISAAEPGTAAIEDGGARGSFRLSAADTQKLFRLQAPLTVATIDQLLASALPGRHQPFRMAGSWGKVVVIDECHAYDVFMRVLLRTVLAWLGAFGVPVVLLSATLPRRVAREYLEAYRSGAAAREGQSPALCEERLEGLPYPGWVYYDSATDVTTSSGTVPGPTTELTLAAHAVPVTGDPRDPVARGRRLAQASAPILAPILDTADHEGGCALVIANTVTSAQMIAAALRAVAPDDCHVHLLHARLPTGQREERTARLEALFGKRDGQTPGQPERPGRAIVVATQVAEQSLDWDFDVVVSELAPLSLLLQRAGRAHRHRPADLIAARWRQWTVHVLAAVEAASNLPVEALPYPHAALLQTWHTILEDAHSSGERQWRRTLRVPDDVQDLVERAEPELSLLEEAEGVFAEALMSWWAEEDVAASRGDQMTVPIPGSGLSRPDLHRLTEADRDVDDVLTTRLGADSLRLLPVWIRDGAFHLAPQGEDPLPGAPAPGKRPSPQAVRTVIDHSIPVRRAPGWQEAVAAQAPAWFAEHPRLADVFVVPFGDTVEHSVIPGADAAPGYLPRTRAPRHTVAFSPDYGLFTAPRRAAEE
ncbi:hypothetical protein GCM10009799_14380 [Nocardiopsis rhodophaea]|uniref:HD Cas3-type domain-containing protein n=1 Tax=Nocardiopsis rhodophaea TaxID=280238 RepID=A0ABN2SNC6_9ACTN